MKKYTFALDLVDDPALIAAYEKYHQHGWPEINQSIVDAGIVNMEIYRTGNRLFMIVEANDEFTFEKKARIDSQSDKVKEWETLMWKFQQPLPWAKPGEKWVLMDKIYDLKSQLSSY